MEAGWSVILKKLYRFEHALLLSQIAALLCLLVANSGLREEDIYLVPHGETFKFLFREISEHC